MDGNSDKEWEKMVAKDFGKDPELNKTVRRATSKGYGSVKPALFVCGIVIFLLIVGLALLFKSHRSSTADLDALKNRIQMLEQNFPQVAGQIILIQQSVSKLNQSAESLTQRIEELSEKVNRLEKGVSATQPRSEAPKAVQTKPATQTRAGSHEVKQGDTLYRIAKKYGISLSELCRLNQISPDHPIKPGQKLLVPPKGPQ